jgi:hypothetical protein
MSSSPRSESETLLAVPTTASSSLLLAEGRLKRLICAVVEKRVDIRFPLKWGCVQQIIELIIVMNKHKNAFQESSEI